MPRARLLIPAILLVLSALAIRSTVFVEAQHNATDTYAITNAKLVTVAGADIEHGTIVVRNGLIAAVGEKVSAPSDARVIDGSGLTVYPGLIDANTNLGLPEPAAAPIPAGGRGGFLAAQLRAAAEPTPVAPNSTQLPGLQPEVMVEDTIKPGGVAIEAARNAGITTALSAPRSGIWMGESALINLAGDTPQEMIVRSPVAMHVGFTPLRAGGFPNSLMGVFAALRQMMLDAGRYAQAQQAYEHSPRGTRRPPIDRSLAALIPVIEGKLPVVMYVNSEREIRRALELSKEFRLRTIIAGGLEAGNVAEQLREQQVPVLLSLDFPRRTTTTVPEADPESLRVLRQRIAAQKTAGKLAAAQVRFAFQSGGLTNAADFIANAAKTIDNGLAHDEALRALTIRAAEIFGVADRMGSLEVGKIANLTVTKGDLFDRSSRLTNLFIDGREVELRPVAARLGPGPGPGSAAAAAEARDPLNGTFGVSLSLSDQNFTGTLVLRHEGNALAGTLQTQVGNSEFSNGTANGDGFQISATANVQGQNVPITIAGTVRGDSISGTLQSTYGSATFTGSRQPAAAPLESPSTAREKPLPSLEPKPPQPQPDETLIRNATVLTITHGTLQNADVLIRKGKIAAIGKGLKSASDARIIDATGKFVMPGIIDCHSHSMLDAINEGSVAVSSMAHTRDVMNATDVDLYRELAGGVTTLNLLHGSANPIGGLNTVVKIKYGRPVADFIFPGAMPGIKFALGENPKRSNFSTIPGQPRRYPGSRMGVEEVIRDAFTRARDYQKSWAEYNAALKRGDQNLLAPRRDLQLEPLVEVLEGKRYVHSHSYRADEILMLINVANEFGFKIRTFQHVLEGYKVAKEIAAHGAGGSTFADFWGYKIEAYDAIPYNTAIMTRAGVVMSVNSDSDERARRLNVEAAKAMRYGNLTEEESLKLITINPAIQLGIQDRVGSLEVGKDGDIVIWNGHPLSVYSRVETTFIDGDIFFDRQQDLAQRAELEKERAQLEQAEPNRPGAGGGPPRTPRGRRPATVDDDLWQGDEP